MICDEDQIQAQVAYLTQAYLGEYCAICGRKFETVAELQRVVRAGGDDMTWAHEKCYRSADED